MYLLLGGQKDEFLTSLLEAIRGAKSEAAIVAAGGFAQSTRLTWAFDSSHSEVRLRLPDGRHLNSDDIEGVVVRRSGAVERADGNSEDYSFIEAENQAALIGWVWSLPCPVINRLPAAVWFHSRLPLSFWNPALRLSGLSPIDCLISNVVQDLRVFGQQNRGAVYTPLTGDGHYRLEDDISWGQLADLGQQFPVHITAPYTELRFACVVGQEVIWDREAQPVAYDVEPALARFAIVAGLSIFEIAVSQTIHGPCVTAVNPEPRLARYCSESRERIIHGVAGLLSGRSVPTSDRFPPGAEIPWRAVRPL
jgi:hypothetical protein